MLASRILGVVGKAMIAAGCLILLFVAYQLWGTGLRTDQAQDDLGTRFRSQQAEVGHPTTTAAGPAATVAPGTTPTGTGRGTPADAEGFPPPKPGDPIGRIVIPKIGADFYMVEGVDLRWLQDGPGHFPGTPFPGQAGNAALAGHRTTFKAPFNRIDELAPGDTITVETLQGTFTYQVMAQPGGTPGEELGHKIVGPSETQILTQPPEGINLLTLMACHPKYSAAQRIVVVARLVDNPAPTTAKSDESKAAGNTFSEAVLQGGSAGDLVGGNPEARMPALLWSLAALAVWFVVWLVTRRWSWRRWPKWAVYACVLPVFLAPLFLAFENINRLLPAGY